MFMMGLRLVMQVQLTKQMERSAKDFADWRKGRERRSCSFVGRCCTPFLPGNSIKPVVCIVVLRPGGSLSLIFQNRPDSWAFAYSP